MTTGWGRGPAECSRGDGGKGGFWGPLSPPCEHTHSSVARVGPFDIQPCWRRGEGLGHDARGLDRKIEGGHFSPISDEKQPRPRGM